LREEQLVCALSEPTLLDWVDISDNIGTMQVVLKCDLQTIRWQVLQRYYNSTDEVARAIAGGGRESLYGPSALLKRLEELKEGRANAKHRSTKNLPASGRSDLIQRMEFSAALVEAGVRELR
jgi:hypothetical protein